MVIHRFLVMFKGDKSSKPCVFPSDSTIPVYSFVHQHVFSWFSFHVVVSQIHPLGLEPLDERIQDSQSLCEVHGQQSFCDPKSTTGSSATNQPSIGQFGWWRTRYPSETVCRFKPKPNKLQHCDATQEQNFKEFARSKVKSKLQLQRSNVATSHVASKTWWWFGSSTIAKHRVRRHQTFNECYFATDPGCLTLAIGCALTHGIRVFFCKDETGMNEMNETGATWCNKIINDTCRIISVDFLVGISVSMPCRWWNRTWMNFCRRKSAWQLPPMQSIPCWRRHLRKHPWQCSVGRYFNQDLWSYSNALVTLLIAGMMNLRIMG